MLLYILAVLCSAAAASSSSSSSDASALLSFKLKADFDGKLSFSSNSSAVDVCEWDGVRCSGDRVVRVAFKGMGLTGSFAPGTLTRLDQLRVLILRSNSLNGPIPDLSGLVRLTYLFLDRNLFTGAIPPSISALRRLRALDLSYNRLSGAVPPLYLTDLKAFNISFNSLSGPIPVTPTLSRFNTASFLSNDGLCGKIVATECHPEQPFFPPSTTSPETPPPPAALGQNAQSQRGVGLYNIRKKPSHRSTLIIGLSIIGSVTLILSVLCLVLAARKMGNSISPNPKTAPEATDAAAAEAVLRIEEENNELTERVKKAQEGMRVLGKSGNLVFCAGEAQAYTLEQLMTASAEILGRGTMGTTYKAVLDDRTIVCVKRLDAGKLAGTNKDEFERHMGSVGSLRHPNLVSLRAYFHAKDEKILVYDYHCNGSLHSLIHGGSGKALHWTSCLKIAGEVAQGLSHIHQAWRLVHGNLKSANVLLGSDFEACLSDYCLCLLAADPFSDEDPNSAAYKAPEIRRSNGHRRPTAKSDVFSFGVLLLELVSGKHPSEHPFLRPEDMVRWVRSVREDDGGGETEMIVEVAMSCRFSSPEQRPDMWQVLKMIQEIKEGVIMEDCQGMGPQTLTGNL